MIQVLIGSMMLASAVVSQVSDGVSVLTLRDAAGSLIASAAITRRADNVEVRVIPAKRRHGGVMDTKLRPLSFPAH